MLACIATLTPTVPTVPYSASDPFLRPALASLIIHVRERVPGNVNDWMGAYQDEFRAVTKKRLTPLTAEEIYLRAKLFGCACALSVRNVVV